VADRVRPDRVDRGRRGTDRRTRAEGGQLSLKPHSNHAPVPMMTTAPASRACSNSPESSPPTSPGHDHLRDRRRRGTGPLRIHLHGPADGVGRQ
jgi:hypothetical protein